MLNNACFTPFPNLCQFKMLDSIFTNKESVKGVDLDQLVLWHHLNLIYTVFKI